MTSEAADTEIPPSKEVSRHTTSDKLMDLDGIGDDPLSILTSLQQRLRHESKAWLRSLLHRRWHGGTERCRCLSRLDLR